MKSVLLLGDATCDVALDAIARNLNQFCKHLRFASVTERLPSLGVVSNPQTHRRMRTRLAPLLEKHACILIASDSPYDNNYFWESDGNLVITSFAHWEKYTNLAKNNGLVSFINIILSRQIEPSLRHDDNTGCAYDFLWDKRGIDARIRNGTICRECMEQIRVVIQTSPGRRLPLFGCSAEDALEDLMVMLDELSTASKREIDVVERWNLRASGSDEFDVFLCHNSKDKASVRHLFRALSDHGLRPWFDEEHLRPGLPWQDELQKVIARIRTAAVIVGPEGLGPWHDLEQRAFINEFARRGCPVIPVILADAAEIPELPLFLQSFTWVDFRKAESDPLRRLIWGVTGKRR